jgi:two-component system sensor histidine kinase/response regulator
MRVNSMKNARKKERETKKHVIEELRPTRNQQRAPAIEQLRSHEQQLRAANQQLQAHEQQLMAANQQLEAREQQLRAANQQLQAHEQQLMAANQQLEAREQQLRAANQQLQAHEQQLMAANQQLEAREQQLRAANQQLQAHEQQLMAANQQLEAREQQLRAANQKLRMLIDYLPDLIYIKDAQCRFTACNWAVANCMGAATPEELIGKTDFDFYPKEQASEYYADEQKIISTGQQLVNKDEPRTDRNGNEQWILTSKLPLRNSQGQVIGLIGISRDITERREDKERLREAKEAAESASKAKSQFLANMSHEIRTPLNAVISISKTLSRSDTGNLTPRQLEGLDIIYRSSQRLLLLINDILDLSKIESGKMEIKLRPFSLDALIAGIRSVVLTLNDNRAVDFIVEKAESVPDNVTSDAQKLHEILTNVISNSIKFTDRGKIILKIYVERERLYFEVSDTGIGIDEKNIEHVFDEFTQADSSTTRKYPGTGLGLAICRKMVQLLGGSIEVDSKLGEGTTVTFYVPLGTQGVTTDEDTTKTDTVPQSPDTGPGSDEVLPRILIAEDDEFSRAAVKMMVGHRYQLIFAGDGREVVEKYFSVSPDIVLMDIMMPLMDGYEAFSEITRTASEPVVPIIALTAKAMKNDRDELLAYGFADYISKPIDDEVLIKTIDKHLAVR